MRVNKPPAKTIFGIEDIEELSHCPWCDSSNYEQWGKDAEPFNTVKCSDCNLVFVNKRLSNQGRKKYYENYYVAVHQAVPDAKVRDKMYRLEFEFINKHIQNGKVLDVGCSGGDFLQYFSEVGFECYGVEPGKTAAKIAKEKIGENIFHSDLCESNFEEQFDLIVFRGTIEHIPNAKQTLEKAVSLLTRNSNSFIYITSTPNIECISTKIFETNWTQHQPEGHIYHFSKKHFDDFFNNHKLKCVDEFYFYEETPYAEPIKDILRVAEAINLKSENKPINFRSPPFYGNMMSLVYRSR
jgi:2-polyprenyl-3-methyl-5-hydroxy-6-metoxy-1,4-benzoquinol methylase